MATDSVAVYAGPANFKLASEAETFRDRQFLRFSDREVGFQSDFHSLSQSITHLVPLQQPNGSFIAPEILPRCDKSDDHLGVAGMLAYYLTLVPDKPEWEDALSRAIRFQLDHLVWKSKGRPGSYVRCLINEDSSLDWCNTLWVLMSVTPILKYSRPFIEKSLYAEIEAFGADIWQYLSQFPVRDENPCHNQLLEYTALGYAYGVSSNRQDVKDSVMAYYKQTLRSLRVKDCGRWIYTEFGRWCPHYSVLSWHALESLLADSGDSTVEEDALEMAAAFNDRLSASGYIYGGSRRDEPGYEEFLYQLWLREKQFGFDRIQMPEPSTQWRNLVYDGHNGRGLASRMPHYAKGRPEQPLTDISSPYAMRKERCSVHFNEDTSAHQISIRGLEILEANTKLRLAGGLTWRTKDGQWKGDEVIANPPANSQLHHYSQSIAAKVGEFEVHATMQRGASWEIRCWWITDGRLLECFYHFLSHGVTRAEEIRFIIGNPYLAEFEGKVHPIREIRGRTSSVPTYGGAQSLRSAGPLWIGNQAIVSTHPLQYIRPDERAFDGFPARNGLLWREQEDSNRVDILLVEQPREVFFRESIFTAVQFGDASLLPEVTSSPNTWECRFGLGIFRAAAQESVWKYQFQSAKGTYELPAPSFKQQKTTLI